MDVARRSVVRISFKWELEQKKQVVSTTTSKSRNKNKVVREKDTRMFIVIPGVIVSKEADSHIMIVDKTFFVEGYMSEIEVQLPTADGYAASGVYEKIATKIGILENFHVYRVNQPNSFTTPIHLEIKALNQQDIVHAFVFPRDPHMPYSTAYCAGSIIFENDEVVFNGCRFHEYSFFGSPIFNGNGHLVGICYAFQGRTHTWPGKLLQEALSYDSSTIGIVPYLYDGVEVNQGD